MLRRLVLLTVAFALVVPATASAEVTIKVGSGKFQEQKYRETFYPNGFRLKGKTGTYRGQVQLEVDEFPYEGTYTDGGPASTDDKGEYAFPKVVLRKNSMVRVRAGTERSKALQLYVYPGVSGKDRVDGDDLVLTATYSGHPGWTPPTNPGFYIYILKRGDSKARRLGGARSMSQVKDGRWRFQGRANLPNSNRSYSFRTFFCIKGLTAAGYGRPWPIDANCGAKTISG
jgi:hypothetical protein